MDLSSELYVWAGLLHTSRNSFFLLFSALDAVSANRIMAVSSFLGTKSTPWCCFSSWTLRQDQFSRDVSPGKTCKKYVGVGRVCFTVPTLLDHWCFYLLKSLSCKTLVAVSLCSEWSGWGLSRFTSAQIPSNVSKLIKRFETSGQLKPFFIEAHGPVRMGFLFFIWYKEDLKAFLLLVFFSPLVNMTDLWPPTRPDTENLDYLPSR